MIKYWYHAESESLFTTNSDQEVQNALENDACELSEEEYTQYCREFDEGRR